MMRTFISPFSTFAVFFLFGACSEKVNVSTEPTPPSANSLLGQPFTDSVGNRAYRTQNPADLKLSKNSDQRVGVYFMPSWDHSSAGGGNEDIFWACLQGKENCPFLTDPAIWGPKGRIYNKKYPYEGPYLDKKPHGSLKGFYKRDDPE